MSFVAEVLLALTPQVVFGMVGGCIGGLFGIDKEEYGTKISSILILVACIAGSAVADVLSTKYGLKSLFGICFISVFAGLFAGFLMEAVKTASPPLAKKLVDKVGKAGLDKIG